MRRQQRQRQAKPEPVVIQAAPVEEPVPEPIEVTMEDIDNAVLNVDADQLTPKEVEWVTELLQKNNGRLGIKSIFIAANSASFSSDPAASPTGTAVHYSGESLFNPDLLNPNSFVCTVMCSIAPKKDTVMGDDYFLPRLKALGEAVPQYSTRPLGLDTRASNNRDAAYWTAEIGEKGHCGILRRKAGAHSNDFFIAATCGAPVYGKEYLQKLKETKSAMTWRQFSEAKETIYWRNACERLACRIAHQVAEAMEVRINSDLEYGTYREDPNSEAETMTAEPGLVQFNSSVEHAIVNTQRSGMIAQFDQCVPVSSLVSDYHVILESPFSGYVGMDVKDQISSSLHIVPSSTGRDIPAEEIDMKSLSPDVASVISKRYTWEGSEVNDRLHPDAYRKCDRPFLAECLDGISTQSILETERYEPVIMKVASRKPRPQ